VDLTARDRIARGWQPEFDIDYADGHQAELFVADVLDSMRDGSNIEVKRDRAAVSTGNVYLEYRCRISGQWVPSGIASTTARLFSVAIAPTVVVTSSVEAVRAVALRYFADKKFRRECVLGGNPTKGVIVPVTRYVLELMQRGPPALSPRALA
jgi:hypothetical protein